MKREYFPYSPYDNFDMLRTAIEVKLKGKLNPEERVHWENGLKNMDRLISEARPGDGQMVGQKTVNDSRNGQNKFGK